MKKLKALWQHLQLTESFAFIMLGIPIGTVVSVIFWVIQFQLSAVQYDITVEKVVMFVIVGWFLLFFKYWLFAFICGLVVTSFRRYVTQKWHSILGGLVCVLIHVVLVREVLFTMLLPIFIAGMCCTHVLVYAENMKEQGNENCYKAK